MDLLTDDTKSTHTAKCINEMQKNLLFEYIFRIRATTLTEKSLASGLTIQLQIVQMRKHIQRTHIPLRLIEQDIRERRSLENVFRFSPFSWCLSIELSAIEQFSQQVGKTSIKKPVRTYKWNHVNGFAMYSTIWNESFWNQLGMIFIKMVNSSQHRTHISCMEWMHWSSHLVSTQ